MPDNLFVGRPSRLNSEIKVSEEQPLYNAGAVHTHVRMMHANLKQVRVAHKATSLFAVMPHAKDALNWWTSVLHIGTSVRGARAHLELATRARGQKTLGTRGLRGGQRSACSTLTV